MDDVRDPHEQAGRTSDEQLLADLRRVLATVDPPPQPVVEAARAAFAVRDLDAELAALVEDSAAATTPVLVRSAVAEARVLCFESPGCSIVLQVEPAGGRRHVVGQVVGGVLGDIRLETSDGVHVVPADELGRFVARDLPAGDLRASCRSPVGRLVRSDWVRI